MKYQSVLQFPGNSLNDFDELIALEETLTKKLAAVAKVDGHDFGSGEMNIFIFTEEPEQSFQRIKPTLASRGNFDSVIAAYGETTGEDYTILWPPGRTEPFRIAGPPPPPLPNSIRNTA